MDESNVDRPSAEDLYIKSLHHPNKEALIADVQRNRPTNPISQGSKQVIHTIGNVKCFELCEISPKVHCLYCLESCQKEAFSAPVAHAWLPQITHEN